MLLVGHHSATRHLAAREDEATTTTQSERTPFAASRGAQLAEQQVELLAQQQTHLGAMLSSLRKEHEVQRGNALRARERVHGDRTSLAKQTCVSARVTCTCAHSALFRGF